jgi:hypothetical protein
MIWLFFTVTAVYTIYLIRKTANEDDKKMAVCSSYDKHTNNLRHSPRKR